ncbi:MAG: hypothetical protein M2R46_04658 [Verrucomicrobia subdivision 3 bacterium]|nr:hypothetical protein [Limisphaerales bacterium]
MQGGGDDRVGAVRTVHDLLYRVADAAAPITANLTLLKLIVMILVGLASLHGNRRSTIAFRIGLRQCATTPAK